MGSAFRRPLLATEHGEFDQGAEALAFALARRHGLRLMTVLPCLSNPEFEAAAPLEAARADAAVGSHRVALERAAVEAGVELELQVRHGDSLDDEILDHARERGADLIVIRRRGRRSFLSRLLIGERVGRVVERAPCSILIVPRLAQPWARGVLVAIDPQTPDAEAARTGAALARGSGLDLRLLAAVRDGADSAAAGLALAPVLREVQDFGVVAQVEVRQGPVADAIIGAAREAGADLLVVGRSGDGAGRQGLGRTAREVVGRAQCAVLIHVRSTASPDPAS